MRLDGKPLDPKDYKLRRHEPRHSEAAGQAVHARHHDLHRSRGQQGAAGPLPLARRLLHAMRGRRLPPHHLFPRPARRARDLHLPHRGRCGRGARPALATATRSSAARSTAASATTPSGTTRTRSPAISSRSSAATSRPSHRPSRRCRAATSISRSTSSTARRRAPPGPWIA